MAESITAPQFPVLPRPTHTLLTEEDKAAGFSDLLQTTVLGETWNESEVSLDAWRIFVPHCKEEQPDQFRFTEVLPGELMFSAFSGNFDDATVELISIHASSGLLDELVNAGSTFQFVAAPGTDREQRYRVARGGKLQKIGLGATFSPFSLGKPSRLAPEPHDPPVITAKRDGHTTVNWTDNGERTGETSKAKYVDLFRRQLLDLADIFYALTSMDKDTFTSYGRVCGVCGVCGRTLADAGSIKRGLGPDCWKRLQQVANG